jgi:hypothetical protein
VVHGGDTEEHSAGEGGIKDCRLIEAVEYSGRRPGSERTEQPGAKAVHVEKWQAQHKPISGSPIPGILERCHAGQKRRMGVYGAFGLARSSRRIDDQCVVAGLPPRGACERPGPLPGQLLDCQNRRTSTERIGPFAIGEGKYRSGISDDVVDFGSGGGRAERNQNRTAAHYGEQGLDRGNGGACAPQDAVARENAPLEQCCGQSGCAAVERRRVHHTPAIPPVDKHRRVRMSRPYPGPDFRKRRS